MLREKPFKMLNSILFQSIPTITYYFFVLGLCDDLQLDDFELQKVKFEYSCVYMDKYILN